MLVFIFGGVEGKGCDGGERRCVRGVWGLWRWMRAGGDGRDVPVAEGYAA